jgi:hypothetical protein
VTAKRLSAPILLAPFGLAMLLAAWAVATRPFDAPDETSHYLRALTIANGQLLGPKVPYRSRRLTRFQLSFVQADARSLRVPTRLLHRTSHV